jgi:hypothetical protein
LQRKKEKKESEKRVRKVMQKRKNNLRKGVFGDLMGHGLKGLMGAPLHQVERAVAVGQCSSSSPGSGQWGGASGSNLSLWGRAGTSA